MILTRKGENFTFAVQLSDGRADKYVQAKLFNSALVQIGFYAVPHFSEGTYYKNDITANTVGVYLVKYVVYPDVAMTIIDKRYRQSMVHIRVEDIVENLSEVIDLSDGRIS